MLNSLAAYEESGRKVGQCRNNRDEVGAMFEKDWFNQARRLEKVEHRSAIDEAFNTAYKAVRHP